MEYTEKQINLAAFQISSNTHEKREKLSQVNLGQSILTIFPYNLKLKKKK